MSAVTGPACETLVCIKLLLFYGGRGAYANKPAAAADQTTGSRTKNRNQPLIFMIRFFFLDRFGLCLKSTLTSTLIVNKRHRRLQSESCCFSLSRSPSDVFVLITRTGRPRGGGGGGGKSTDAWASLKRPFQSSKLLWSCVIAEKQPASQALRKEGRSLLIYASATQTGFDAFGRRFPSVSFEALKKPKDNSGRSKSATTSFVY